MKDVTIDKGKLAGKDVYANRSFKQCDIALCDITKGKAITTNATKMIQPKESSRPICPAKTIEHLTKVLMTLTI